MPKFVAIRDNFGYLGTYWRKGEVLDADVKPNEHFEPYGQSLARATREEAAKKEAEAKATETVEKAVKARRTKKEN